MPLVFLYRSQTISPKTPNETLAEKGGFLGYIHMAEKVWSPDIVNHDGCCGWTPQTEVFCLSKHGRDIKDTNKGQHGLTGIVGWLVSLTGNSDVLLILYDLHWLFLKCHEMNLWMRLFWSSRNSLLFQTSKAQNQIHKCSLYNLIVNYLKSVHSDLIL